MFEVTEKAAQSLEKYIKEYDYNAPIRISIVQKGGCSGMALGMVFDKDVMDDDKTFSEGNLKFVVEEALITACGEIKVDYVEAGYRSGFSITSTIPIEGGNCGSCSGECES